MDFSKFEEQVFLVTVRIENLTDDEVGTGFLVTKPVGEGHCRILLFSNKHVIWGKKDKNNLDASKSLRLTLHKRESDGSHDLGSIHTFQMDVSRDDTGYYEHPDRDVDVACINISDASNKGIDLHYKALDAENFFNFKRSEIVSGERIVFVGYPTGFYDQKNFLPILRTGTIASIPAVDFNGHPQILIDAQVFPGSSGSPVFVAVSGHYRLLGVISEAFYKGLDFVEMEKTNQESKPLRIPTQWIGLGLLFTTETIRQVYDLVPSN